MKLRIHKFNNGKLFAVVDKKRVRSDYFKSKKRAKKELKKLKMGIRTDLSFQPMQAL